MQAGSRTTALLLAQLWLWLWLIPTIAMAIGINYGTISTSLPSHTEVAQLIASTSINKVKIYSADPHILTAFSKSKPLIEGMVVCVPNEQIVALANSPVAAYRWVKQYLYPFRHSLPLATVAVGNEVLTASAGTQTTVPANCLVLAMENVHSALVNLSMDGQIKVSSPHNMAILASSFPPSSATFASGGPLLPSGMKPVLDFLYRTGSALMVNAYPYFAYAHDPERVLLDFALFRSMAKPVVDQKTGLTYTNLFDAQVDAAYFAMHNAGYDNIPVIVSETGWPSAGDPLETGATLANAAEYNGNLIRHLSSGKGSPLKPNVTVDTYIFALFNEDNKPGPSSERHFGLFQPDKSLVYDVGLLKAALPPNDQPSQPPPQATNGATAIWCVARPSVDTQTLQKVLDFCCGNGGADCAPIQNGGACAQPDSLVSHASYAMNSYYQRHGRNFWNCFFNGTGLVTPTDPSYGACAYPPQ